MRTADVSRPWRWPVAVFVLCLLLTVLANRAIQRELDLVAQAEFQRLSERVAIDTKRRFLLPAYGLMGARGIFATGTHVGLREFRAYVASRDLPREFPGIRGFGFIERVQRDSVDRFVAAARREGAPEFAVKTSGAHPDLYVVKYIEPLEDNAAALGFDAGAEAARRTAIEQAVNSGKPTLTSPIALVQDQRGGRGFLLMLPVYRNGVQLDSEAQRQHHLLGILYAPIVARELLHGVADVAGQQLDVEIFDGPQARLQDQVFDDDGHVAAAASSPPTQRAARFSASRSMLLGERTLTLRTTTTPAFDAVHTDPSAVVATVSGLVLSVLAAWGAWLQASGRIRVEARARALTIELERLARIVEHTSNAVSTVDPRGRITWVNEAFTRISGYELEEARGRTMRELVGSGLTDRRELERLEHGLRTGTAAAAEVLNRARDGHVYWMKVDVQPTFDNQGALVGFMQIGTDITAMKLAEEQLRSARDEAAALATKLETMALVARHTSDAVVVTDAQRHILWVNEGFTRLTGYSSDEAAGHSPGALLQCEATDRAEVDRLRKALDEGRGFRGELINRAKSGRTYWVEIRITPLHDADGRLSRFVAIQSDITDRKAAAAELEAQRDWLTQILDGVNAGEGEVNLRSGQIRWSERWASMLGYTYDEATALAPTWGSPLHHPDDLASTARAIALYQRGEAQRIILEHRMRHRDGHWVWLQSRVKTSSFGSDGNPEWVTGANFDITARKLAIQELHEAQQQLTEANSALVRADQFLREVTDNIPGMVGYWDTDRRCRFANKAYLTWFGRSPEQMLGMRIEDLMGEDLYRRNEPYVLGALAGEPQTFERQLTRADGSVGHVLADYIPHRVDGAVQGFIVLVTDVTALKRAGEELARLNGELALRAEEAESASRAKDAFLATMSHELRSPLNGIVGMAELLTYGALDQEQERSVRTIIESGTVLSRLIGDVLDFSKIEAGRMELDLTEFEIEPLVEEVCAALLPMALHQRVRLTAWVDDAVKRKLVGDPLRVRQLLTNLVGNAIKFSAREDCETGRVSVRVASEGENLLVRIVDNGIGMTRETVARLFTPFTQAEASTTRRFGGTGLGLAICKRLVALMGGRIDVHSEPGQGSEFSLTLPLPACAVQPEPATPTLTGLRCVLLNSFDLPLPQLRQWLEAAGAEVLEAGSLPQAQQLALAVAARGEPGIVVRAADATGAASVAPALPAGTPRELHVGYGRRESVRATSPTVMAIDLLRREPFVHAVGAVAGRHVLTPWPNARFDAPRRGDVPAVPRSARTAGDLILVAEDDATSQAVILRQLALLGYSAEFVPNGLQALTRLQAGSYALLLTDVHMPGLDGYALSRQIRERESSGECARLPILALTANAMTGEAERARAAGIDDYLIKPVPLATLHAALARWVPARRPQRVLTEVATADAATGTGRPRGVADTPLSPPDVLNLRVPRELIGDDADALNDLLTHYEVSAQRYAADLQAALRSGDANAVAAVAHKLKSASRSVGALALAEACAALELAAKLV